MNIVLSVLAVVILATGIFVERKVNEGPTPELQTSEVLSEQKVEDVVDIVITPTSSPVPTLANVDNVESTQKQSPQTNIAKFMYPSSTLVSETSSKIELQSNDAVTVITDWYKQKIQSENMNVTSFVVTSTNEHVLNKLSGSNGEVSILITIEKLPGAITTITVSNN